MSGCRKGHSRSTQIERLLRLLNEKLARNFCHPAFDCSSSIEVRFERLVAGAMAIGRKPHSETSPGNRRTQRPQQRHLFKWCADSSGCRNRSAASAIDREPVKTTAGPTVCPRAKSVTHKARRTSVTHAVTRENAAIPTFRSTSCIFFWMRQQLMQKLFRTRVFSAELTNHFRV